jgi:hypothetical protein
MASVEGRRFRALADSVGGQVTPQTEFEFKQESDLVWARYSGGSIRLGFLVGTARFEELAFRYVHVDVNGSTHSGRSVDRIEALADGRLRLHERWVWESEAGTGTSVLEEVKPPEWGDDR